MSKEKTKIYDKEKCDKLFNDICKDKKFYAYLHKVMINTYNEYYGLHNVMEVDDFKSECFLKIYKSLDLFDSNKSTLRNFCILCIKSTALQELRKSRSTKNKLKNKENLISLESEIFDSDGCEFINIISGKDDEYFFKDFKKEVLKAIDKLSPREKETMLMKIEGYKTGQIADMLGTTSNNITNRLSKARIKLRKYLNIEE